jgi:hypothetical protein
MKFRFAAAVVPVLVFGIAAGASARPDRPDAKGLRLPGVARPVGAVAAGQSRATSIVGTAWTAENTPITFARLRLRNVLSGRIDAITVANEAGQFAFEGVQGGSYVVELVNEAGKVQVVGHVFTIAPGETVATFVRLATRVPWFVGFFGNSVSAVSAAAASEGITALAPLARPASALR